MSQPTTGRAPSWRRLPVGAELAPGGGAHFRVWAPRRRRVEVVAGDRVATSLAAEPGGYFSGTVADVGVGTHYRLCLDGGDCYADPASRFQPEGPHGPSEILDPARYAWGDAGWRGPSLDGAVLYEMHVGTFTSEGTWRAAAGQLEALADTGITVVEVMPVADFPGRFGWGYDGVNLFAPTRLYGHPDDMRAFVDRAHALGIGVILDVVYNHLGPDGNCLEQFAAEYFTDRHKTDWGKPPNFYGPGSAAVRELYLANARYWIDEFHLDGLRLDATQNIYDESSPHILAEVGRVAREAARGRATILIAENEPQDRTLVTPADAGGYELDAVWNDDFHHTALVALTGQNEAYYSDYKGTPQELVSAAKYGFLYQGQRYEWQKKRRGTPSHGIPRQRFVHFIENHDQVANSARGCRVHQRTSPGRHRAITTLLLLGPQTPMLFQGQEFSASAPFLFFADHKPELAREVRKGRREFLGQFPSIATAAVQEQLADPADPETFERCRLDHAERERHGEAHALHRDLLRLRREDPVLRLQGRDGIDGAVLSSGAFVLRWFADDGDDRLLLVNLGQALRLAPAPEPLLAPPAGRRWGLLWSSEDPRYGGGGTPAVDSDEGWRLPGEAAVALIPARHGE
ncbi:MAG TPA: malto-oligosyltrehalose trehalohydrolase [Gemmatimonadaceae bacterium]|nr:malto-oligosyltrehalose trehalohydrolase [Gemmatimonadaceae bacterium]